MGMKIMTEDTKNEWPWSRLEIAPTSDDRAIKSAYARILKRDRVHGDPEKFQALKEARDFAMSLETEFSDECHESQVSDCKVADEAEQAESKNLKDDDELNSGNVTVYTSFILNELTADRSESSPPESSNPPSLPESIEEKVTAFLANPWIRTLVQEWKIFFDELPLLSQAENFMLEARIANAIDDWLDGIHNFPNLQVLEYLFDRFQWNSVGSKLPFFLGELRIRRLKTVMSGYAVVV